MDCSKFLSNFKPTFGPSNLDKYCGSNEKNELKLILKNFPELKQNSIINDEKSKKKFKIPGDVKQIIKEEVKKNINKESLTFDYSIISSNVNEKIQEKANNNSFSNANSQIHSNFEDEETDYETDNDYISDESYNDIEKLNQSIQRQINFERGKEIEEPTIKKINETEKTKFEKNTKFIKKDMGLFYIYGKPDAIDRENAIVLEIKSTNLKMNEKLKNKDKIQCWCYLKLTELNVCWCIYRYPDGRQQKFVIDYDKNKFNEEVVKKLEKLVLKYRNMSEQEFKELLKKHEINKD